MFYSRPQKKDEELPNLFRDDTITLLLKPNRDSTV